MSPGLSDQRIAGPMRDRAATGAPRTVTTGKALISVAGVLGALASMSCCVVPFALFFLGVSGAWIGNLTALAPYKPIFIAATLGLLGAGFIMVYRSPKAACADGSPCASPSSTRIAKIGLWTATVLVLIAMTFSYWAPVLVGA